MVHITALLPRRDITSIELTAPRLVRGLVQGVLPPTLLALLFILLPFALRGKPPLPVDFQALKGLAGQLLHGTSVYPDTH
jgi:hypothetical protein